MRRLLAVGLAIAALLASASAEAFPRVLLCFGENNNNAATQIATGINPKGANFDVVDMVNCSTTTPTLQQMKGYDAVFVWDDQFFDDQITLGNNLADYVDAGGGVVLAMYDLYSSGGADLSIAGRWATGNGGTGYGCIVPGDQKTGTLAATANDPNNPLASGVATLLADDIGVGGLNTGAASVWSYTNGQPAIATCAPNNHYRVDLNFYPKPSAWTGDGYPMIVNALTAVAGGLSPIRATPSPATFPDTGTGGVSAPLAITLTNASALPQTITGLTITGTNAAEFGVINPPAWPVTLQPTQAVVLNVSFAPVAMGPRSATLSVAIQAQQGQAAPQPAQVGLSGNGIGAKLMVTPDPVNVGGTQLGVPISTSITISNGGGGKIVISGLSLSNPAFSITAAPNLPVAINNGGAFNVTIGFSPAQNGITSDNLLLTTNDPNTPTLKVPVSGYAGPPAIAVDAGTIAFGNVNLTAQSTAQVVNVMNTGYSDLAVTGLSLVGMNAGDFVLDKKSLPATIPALSSAPISVLFAPTALGNRSAQILITSNDPNTPQKSINLFGTGTSATLAVSPMTLDFASVRLGTESAAKSIVVSSMGTGQLRVMSFTITGPNATAFLQSGGQVAPFAIAANGSAMIGVACKPDTFGSLTATGTLVTDVGMAEVALTCTGTSPRLSVTPNQILFGQVPVNTSSAQVAVTFTNTGTDTLNFSDLEITGTNASDFVSSDMASPPIAVMAGQTLTFHVTFNPTAPSAETAQIIFTTDDPLLPSGYIDMMGSGAEASFSVTPQPLDFGTVNVGASSPAMPVTITNTGDLAIQITSVSLAGSEANAFTLDHAINSMNPITLVPMQSFAVHVTYAPNAGGAVSATLTVSATGITPVTITIKGNGYAPTVQIGVPGGSAAGTYAFGSVPLGQSSAPVEFKLRNGGSDSVTIDHASATASQFAVDLSKTQLTLAAGGQTSIFITYTPTKVGTDNATFNVYLAGATTPSSMLTLSGSGIAAVKSGGCSMSGRASNNPVGATAFLMLSLAILFVRRRSMEVR